MEAHNHPGEETEQPDPVNTSKTPCALQKVTEVSKRMEQHLMWSFACMEDEERRELANSFVLPKVAVMKTPELDKIHVMAAKNTKSNDQALARTQALNSDTLAPLMEVLEILNKEEEDFTTEHLNQKVLEEYNKELLTLPKEGDLSSSRLSRNCFHVMLLNTWTN
ncbi:uncharacterized protein [Dysidea avara]|uniref:uncharacterized protein n=1 Tax=Dysidea avara TaxID=196820 RepID=UPI0033263A97